MMNKDLSVDAPEFIPRAAVSAKPKKSKDERACPRKRRKPKPKDHDKAIATLYHGYAIVMYTSYELI
jgi:hypothetical protein